jgi:hypothetical protein
MVHVDVSMEEQIFSHILWKVQGSGFKLHPSVPRIGKNETILAPKQNIGVSHNKLVQHGYGDRMNESHGWGWMGSHYYSRRYRVKTY